MTDIVQNGPTVYTPPRVETPPDMYVQADDGEPVTRHGRGRGMVDAQEVNNAYFDRRGAGIRGT